MVLKSIPYSELSQLSHSDLSYITGDKNLEPFFEFSFDKEGLLKALSQRKFSIDQRRILHSSIISQYQKLGLPIPEVTDLILDENTYTITTAHQPSLLTGPLYNIFKICSTIKLSRILNEELKDKKIIPVFLMNGEDHDWKEINHLHVFGKRIEWDRTVTGPVGRIDVTDINVITEQLLPLLEREPYYNEVKSLIDQSLIGVSTFGDFHQKLLSLLFQKTSLIVLTSDDASLKKSVVPLFTKEMKEHFIHKNVTSTQAELKESGFKPQAFSREVNLFYMADGLRERLEPVPDGLLRTESKIVLTQNDLNEILEDHPERLSPNVLLRTLYQESILPNIAYVGGGGEIAYWLETKRAFQDAGIDFPVLIRRNSFAIADDSFMQNLEKFKLDWIDLGKDPESVSKQYLRSVSAINLDFTEETHLLESAYAQLANKAKLIDPNLQASILADSTKASKQFEQLSSRVIRAQKQQEETSLKKIQKLRDKLFPENGLQERYENFLPYLAKYGYSLLDDLTNSSDPLIKEFRLLVLPQH